MGRPGTRTTRRTPESHHALLNGIGMVLVDAHALVKPSVMPAADVMPSLTSRIDARACPRRTSRLTLLMLPAPSAQGSLNHLVPAPGWRGAWVVHPCGCLSGSPIARRASSCQACVVIGVRPDRQERPLDASICMRHDGKSTVSSPTLTRTAAQCT